MLEWFSQGLQALYIVLAGWVQQFITNADWQFLIAPIAIAVVGFVILEVVIFIRRSTNG